MLRYLAAKIGFAPIAKLIARKKLELELARYARIASALIRQIDNDTEALAYAQIRQMSTIAQLMKLNTHEQDYG